MTADPPTRDVQPDGPANPPQPAPEATERAVGRSGHPQPTQALTAAVARTLAEQYGPADRFSIDEVTAALLAGGEIRQEWGARYHNPDDGDVDTWCDTREEAERMIAARYQGVAPWRHPSSLIRRYIVVTAAEVTP